MNLILYYILVFSPLFGTVYLRDNLTPYEFVLILAVYVFLYRPVIDAIKLIKQGRITKNEMYKTFLPLSNLKYFKDLYLR